MSTEAPGHSPSPSAGDPVEMFGPYRLEELIGRGGMGEVYRASTPAASARSRSSGCTRALADDGVYQARFRRESRMAARLSCRTSSRSTTSARSTAGSTSTCGSSTASTWPTRSSATAGSTRARGRRSSRQVAGALDAAHADGLVHRDVKPSNVLITQHRGRDSSTSIDFGIARATGGDTKAAHRHRLGDRHARLHGAGAVRRPGSTAASTSTRSAACCTRLSGAPPVPLRAPRADVRPRQRAPAAALRARPGRRRRSTGARDGDGQGPGPPLRAAATSPTPRCRPSAARRPRARPARRTTAPPSRCRRRVRRRCGCRPGCREPRPAGGRPALRAFAPRTCPGAGRAPARGPAVDTGRPDAGSVAIRHAAGLGTPARRRVRPPARLRHAGLHRRPARVPRRPAGLRAAGLRHRPYPPPPGGPQPGSYGQPPQPPKSGKGKVIPMVAGIAAVRCSSRWARSCCSTRTRRPRSPRRTRGRPRARPRRPDPPRRRRPRRRPVSPRSRRSSRT